MSSSKNSATRPKKPTTRRRKKPARSLWRWWPVLLGCVLAPLTVRLVDILTLTGPWGARALEPWAFLMQAHSVHLPYWLPGSWVDGFISGVLWLQFPVYGFLVVMLQRKLRFGTSVSLIAAFHLIGFLVLAAVANS